MVIHKLIMRLIGGALMIVFAEMVLPNTRAAQSAKRAFALIQTAMVIEPIFELLGGI